MSAAASGPEDILRAVERWARVRGVDFTEPADAPAMPALALAWALLVETDAGRVDVGRCPACSRRGGPEEWALEVHELGPHPYENMGRDARVSLLVSHGWSVEHVTVKAPLRSFEGRRICTIRMTRQCPACNVTGRETIPVARLLLDAASGDATALEHLPKHADRLQAEGDPRGELLAWALGPWSGEPVDFGPCDDDRCEDGMTDSGGVTQWDTAAMVRCPACKGSARMLGHPHTAAALRWLEWLTWAREDAAPFEAARSAGVVATRGEFELLQRLSESFVATTNPHTTSEMQAWYESVDEWRRRLHPALASFPGPR